MTNIPEALALFLSEYIEKERITQKAFAEKAELNPTDIGRYLKAQISVGSRILDKMATACNVPVFYLLMSPQERAKWDEVTGPTTAVTPEANLRSLITSVAKLDNQQVQNLLMTIKTFAYDQQGEEVIRSLKLEQARRRKPTV